MSGYYYDLPFQEEKTWKSSKAKWFISQFQGGDTLLAFTDVLFPSSWMVMCLFMLRLILRKVWDEFYK